MSTPPSPSAPLAPSNETRTAPEPEALLSKPFLLALCVQFSLGLSYASFFLLPKYLSRQFHAGPEVIGAVAAMALLAGVAAVPFIGAAIDNSSRRSIISAGALVNALSASGFALVHGIGLPLYALRAAYGISYALVFNGLITLAADLAPAKRLGQAIGLCGAAGTLANALAPTLGEYIADHQGWPLLFWLAGGASLCAAGLSLLIREPAARNAATFEKIALPSAWRLVLEPERAGVFLCSAAAGAGFGVMFTFTQPFALLLGARLVSSFFIGYTASAMTARLGLGSLADTFGRRRVAFGALALYGVVVCMTSQLRPYQLVAVGAGLGLAHGMLYPALNALAIHSVPRARRGAVMSYFLGCFNAGFAFWVMGMGVLAKHQGYPILFLLTGVLVWASLLVLPKKTVGISA